ncbi:MAG: HAD-IC family P-type ATPase, partial [bacterium]|nr:HAD-IC family P-type ATPase [bacterium]
DYIDSLFIGIALILNTVLGFIQERKAQHSLHALRNMVTPTATVLRDGTLFSIDARLLVPGDIVMVNAGDHIPADGRLVEAVHLSINESLVTGESEPVAKTVDHENAVRMGTTVVSGRGVILIEETGMRTYLGTIARTLASTPEEKTPLQHQLTSLAKTLAIVATGVSIIVFFIGLLRGESPATFFATIVALAVSAVPEGMVVSLTVILALGMQRILKRKALVRRLISAETLGSVSTLCVDKTGTLTEGIMRVVTVHCEDMASAVRASVFANNRADSLEIALWEWAENFKHADPQVLVDEHPRTDELPFDETHKYMAVLTEGHLWVKGAPEIVLDMSRLTKTEKDEWLTLVDRSAERGLRIIALAQKEHKTGTLSHSSLNDLRFIGILGISDPVRPSVRSALSTCRHAGIAVTVITGDYRGTSEAVMRELGFEPKEGEVMDGTLLKDIPESQLVQRIGSIRLFYRVSPHEKLKIVRVLQSTGEIVGMMGDGVNDALSIKQADIGIVVASSSDVAKENADLVLLDSNFGTIVAAIEEGRGIFDNIRKVVLYLLSDSFSEIILISVALASGLPLPLTASQILWINIVSDGLPSLALTVEPKENDLMSRPPRKRSSHVLDRQVKSLIALISILTGFGTLALYAFVLQRGATLEYAQTLAFVLLGTDSLIYALSCQNLTKPLSFGRVAQNPWLMGAIATGFGLQIAAVYHPWAPSLFRTVPLGISDWLLVGTSGVALLCLIEGTKAVFSAGERRRVIV